ncbi:hypothetical protein PBI_SARFIRE_60 [Mycobacterium phage SarFire]|uniref:hypothetical protein n=1 Tax=Mycobacterium phage SarFire TaxID=1340827 RepID=UPI0003897D00|nr:hypothetical protein P765_gp60 [Mycobacterium phage SarFire]AGT20591.1 hypothetical protein PBI_SARFIRE_60 [Mycobacterium phage SarFire]AJA43635.1 hypothetical protein PBI_THOR_60 [Mycobacterium phage Thor]
MNPELRDVLTEALVEASYDYWYEKQTLGVDSRGKDVCAYLVDRLLSIPGVAVIQLPEPNSTRYEDEDDEFPPADRLAWWHPGSLFGISQWGYPNEVQIAYNGEPFKPVNIIEARFIAAALLAAAAAAVVAEGEDNHA